MRRPSIIILFLVLSILVFAAKDSPPFSFFETAVQRIFATPRAALYLLKTKIGEGNGEIARVKLENRELIEKMVDYEFLKKDNEALRSQFENSPINLKNLLAARVVGFSGNTSLPTMLVIDKGRKNGVVSDMTVIVNKNFVGRVEQVGESYSKIILPTNKSFKALGKTQDRGAGGVIAGKEDFIIFDQVVITDDLKKGDIVLTSGELELTGIGIQPDFIVGKISSIQSIPSKPFQSAKIDSLVDYSRFSWVFIVK